MGKSVSLVYRLDDSVTMELINKHYVPRCINAAKPRKMSSKDVNYLSYQVYIDAEYCDKISQYSLLETDMHVRDFKKRLSSFYPRIVYNGI